MKKKRPPHPRLKDVPSVSGAEFLRRWDKARDLLDQGRIRSFCPSVFSDGYATMEIDGRLACWTADPV